MLTIIATIIFIGPKSSHCLPLSRVAEVARRHAKKFGLGPTYSTTCFMLNSHPGGYFCPLKSDLGVFWPFRGTDFIMGENQNANFSKRAPCPILKFLVVIREVILQKNGTNLSTGELFFGFQPYKSLCKERKKNNL